jgi:hypothetical protein
MQRLLVALLLVAGTFAGAAQAQTRFVVVNGQRLNDMQIAYLDRVQCARIPNGKYWLNSMTGAWGYAGIPITQGYLGGACGGSQQRHRSLSERGLLYTPGDLNFR